MFTDNTYHFVRSLSENYTYYSSGVNMKFTVRLFKRSFFLH